MISGDARRMEMPVALVLLVTLSPLLIYIGAGADSAVGEATLRLADRGHARHKRCTCESYLDRECVYYCHLGVIWVNSPERTVPYGVGASHRERRSTLDGGDGALRRGGLAQRCACSTRNDRPCRDFCRTQEPPLRS